MTTRANDPGLDQRVRSAILERVAAGESIPDATRTVGLNAVDEAADNGLGAPEMDFIARHVCRLGADLMARVGELVAA